MSNLSRQKVEQHEDTFGPCVRVGGRDYVALGEVESAHQPGDDVLVTRPRPGPRVGDVRAPEQVSVRGAGGGRTETWYELAGVMIQSPAGAGRLNRMADDERQHSRARGRRR